jgi:hypothetical protein
MLPRLYPELIWLKMRNAQELLVEISDVTSTKCETIKDDFKNMYPRP